MLSVPINYKIRNEAISKQPVYVAEIFWNNGNTGVDNTNDIYFATCDINDTTGFLYPDRWFPFLKSDSIGSMSQTVDPINGVSSIGSIDITITDYNGMVSDIIRAADAAGHGLRRQRISIYMMYRGMDWADRALIRTMQVNDLSLTRLNEYRLTAADVQRQMQKTVFNPSKTTTTATVAASGAVTVGVNDARAFSLGTSVTYGASGFIKIGDEIMRWNSRTDNSFNVPAAGRGVFGTVAASSAIGDTVDEIFYLNENPITLAMKILESSGTNGANGVHDVLPAGWGCNMQAGIDVDESGWFSIGELLTGLSTSHLATDGIQFEFVLDKGVEAKKFIEDSILKIIGAYGFVMGDGQYSIRAYSDLSNAAKENAVVTLDRNAVVKWEDLTYNYNDLANQVWLEYDEQPKLSGKFIRNALFIDSVSIKKWGEAKQLKYQAAGIMPTSLTAAQLYQRFQRVGSRYSRPPMQIPLTLLPKYHTLEIGDIVRVSLPIRDLFTGQQLDRAFEIIATQLKPSTGEVAVKCLAQPEHAAFWFGGVGEVNSVTISPASGNIPAGTTQQMVARAFDGLGLQIHIPAITWYATGNLTIDSAGLVTAGAVGDGTVYAVIGSKVSNISTITVTASANTNAVASVAVMPSSVKIKAGDTQQMIAIAYDLFGSMVNGVTFNWNSTVPGVATIPAGSGIAKLLTAVANGTSNVTATETVSSISSPASAVIVATPDTPTYTPPTYADSAFQIGTQITSMGPVGGPHTIPNGHVFAAGDYWFDGDLNLPTNYTCYVNVHVRIFSLGTININGTIDGRGRGGAGGGYAIGSGRIPSRPTSEIGFVGIGGQSGNATYVGEQGYPLNPQYGSMPEISVIPVAVNGTGQVTAVSGLPQYNVGVNVGLAGGGGGANRWFGLSGTEYRDPGASGGAGLLLMARGIYISSGLVDLRGADGDAASWHTYGFSYYPPLTSYGSPGGGGGGSFVALAQADVNGLPVMSINTSRIYVSGGVGGVAIYEPPAPATVADGRWVDGLPGTPGGIKTKVIG
jgi:hypothetical protein